jgi:hypothetical protein
VKQLVSRKLSACLGGREDAHLVLLGTEDGGEIVGHVDVIEMNALGLGEDDL